MKLEGIFENRLVTSSNRSVYIEMPDEEFQKIGQIPNPTHGLNSIPFRLKTTRYWNKIPEKLVGSIHSVNVWRLAANEFLANVDRWVYYSFDRGRSWELVLTLPESSGVRGVLPTAVTQHDSYLYIGEYLTSYDGSPRILRSSDKGQSWEPVLSSPECRHFHAVQSDPFSDKLWITTGDTDSESQIGYLSNGEFHLVGSGSQLWRTVSLVFTSDAIIWGMDCPYTDENKILKLDRDKINQEPEDLHSVRNPIYYATSISTENEKLVVFSTGCASGSDTTAPDSANEFDGTQKAKVWMGGSSDNYSTWIEVISLVRRKNVFDVLGIPKLSANAYVFLEGDKYRGLFINPYNTNSNNCEILNIGIEILEEELFNARQ